MFPDTRWTLVRRAQGAEGRLALEALLMAYWTPVFRLFRARGAPPQDAEELVQELFTELVQEDGLARVSEARGRFRTWLRACATHHHLRALERGRTQKRGGDVRFVFDASTLVEAEATSAVPPDAELAFDRAWADAVMARAMDNLRQEYEGGARTGDFSLVTRAFGGDAPDMRTMAAAANMSVPQLKSFLHRARGRFRELIAAELTHTIGDPGELDEEMAALFAALAR